MKHLSSVILILLPAVLSAQNTWTQKANFGSTGRWGAAGFAIGTKGYIGTGYDGTLRSDFWEWDQATNTWTQKANYGGGNMFEGIGFSVGNKGYIGMGSNGSSPQTAMWEYDPANNTWTQKAPYPGSGRRYPSAFSIGNKAYIGLGNDNSGPYWNDLYEFDPLANTWTIKLSLQAIGRAGAPAFSIGNKGYVGLGNDNQSPDYASVDFWEYDPGTNTWTQKANFGGPARRSTGAFSIGGRGFIGLGIEGNTSTTYYTDFWEYDPVANSWIQRATFPGNGRHTAVGFSIGSYGYYGTGGTASLSSLEFWEYHSYYTGTEDQEKYNCDVNVFPNPIEEEGSMQITSDKEVRNASLNFYDTQGRMVRKIDGVNANVSIKREALESGIYFYELVMEGRILATGKICFR